MKMLPRYTKVMNLGNSGTERALIGPIVMQEKIDGSQFRFGVNEDGELIMGSKAVNWERDSWDKMFKAGCDYLLSIEDIIKQNYKPDTYFFCEYLQGPKHNVLKYDRVPEGHLVLFDILQAGQWIQSRESLEATAIELEIDAVPEIYNGEVELPILDFLKHTVEETESFLGGTKIEGIVIKNYGEWIHVGGAIFPVFTKYVREAYREQHAKDWKVKAPKASLQGYFQSFNNENRWLKAIQHLKEKGELTNSVKDIGALLKEIQQDIKEEDTETIKEVLFKHFSKDLLRTAIKGFPEWYKEYLIKENVEGVDINTSEMVE